MKKIEIIQLLKFVVKSLVEKDFEILYQRDKEKRIAVDEMIAVLLEYPGELTFPSEDAFNNYEDYGEPEDNENFIEFDLWFNHQQSDLTISLTAFRNHQYSIDDIRVL